MKKKKKLGAAVTFCVGMLSLASCSQPQTSYGAPVSDSESECYSSLADEPEEVYGPPVEDESSEGAETDDSLYVEPQVVYGPPPAQDTPDTIQ